MNMATNRNHFNSSEVNHSDSMRGNDTHATTITERSIIDELVQEYIKSVILTLCVMFDADGNTLGRQSVDGRTKRRSSERTLYIDEYTVNILKAWREYAALYTKTGFAPDDYIFGNTRSVRYTYCGFRSVLIRHLDIQHGKSHKLAALHRIRHTVATRAAEEGASTIELMQLLGDNQERSVLRYTGKSQLIAKNNRDRISRSMQGIRT